MTTRDQRSVRLDRLPEVDQWSSKIGTLVGLTVFRHS